ncbi:MAG: TIGR00730 family Rossman fold protein [Chloroflexaceae bacterium]|nr:TIGR00730 family Rossman fold protein [Chloroflexaceae bacterium]
MYAICVYCGSRSGIRPEYEAVAAAFGQALAERGWQLVYGGGSIGLMGVLARAVLEHGGYVTGVIPQALLAAEVGLVEASDLIVVETLRERKALMDARSHAFVALPGGFGTFEELLEVITLRQLRYHDKPILVLNQDGYYDPLQSLFSHAIAQGFVRPDQAHLYELVPNMDDILERLAVHRARLNR